MHFSGALSAVSITAAALLLGHPTMAQDVEICSGDGLIAKTIMTHRQMGGWDVNTMMKKFGEEPGLRAMILDAYGQPALQTKTTRQVMIDEFVNKWSLKCYQDGPAISLKTD